MRTVKILFLTVFSLLASCSSGDVSKWFTALPATPAEGIDKKEFIRQYEKNKEAWDLAFEFLDRKDLSGLPDGRYEISDDGVYANIQSYTTKDTSVFEVHRKYIDIQYVLSGSEIIEVTPADSMIGMIEEYSEAKDIAFYRYSADIERVAVNPETYVVLFPKDGHKPCMSPDGHPEKVKKVVVKIPYK